MNTDYDSTYKYKKYLSKFENAVRKNDSNRADLYAKKLELYGNVIQAGGARIDDQVQEAEQQLTQAIQQLNAKQPDTAEIQQRIQALRDKFNTLAQKYVNSGNQMKQFLEQVRTQINGVQFNPIDIQIPESEQDIDTLLNNILATQQAAA